MPKSEKNMPFNAGISRAIYRFEVLLMVCGSLALAALAVWAEIGRVVL